MAIPGTQDRRRDRPKIYFVRSRAVPTFGVLETTALHARVGTPVPNHVEGRRPHFL
jgi:hypothetical protein